MTLLCMVRYTPVHSKNELELTLDMHNIQLQIDFINKNKFSCR